MTFLQSIIRTVPYLLYILKFPKCFYTYFLPRFEILSIMHCVIGRADITPLSVLQRRNVRLSEVSRLGPVLFSELQALRRGEQEACSKF